MWKEFRKFALQGRILDLAIGVIVGGAFQLVVNSFVNDIVMPFISTLIGTVDFASLAFKIGETEIKYGSFLANILNFFIMALIVFFVIHSLNKIDRTLDKKNLEELKAKALKNPKYKKRLEKLEKELETQTKPCPYCFSQINTKATKCSECTSNLKDITTEK